MESGRDEGSPSSTARGADSDSPGSKADESRSSPLPSARGAQVHSHEHPYLEYASHQGSGGHGGGSPVSPTAARIHGLLAEREKQRLPALKGGQLLPLEDWVQRNTEATGASPTFHSHLEEAFATRSLHQAMGMGDLLGDSAVRFDDQGTAREDPDKAVLASKILRGASCDHPLPSPDILSRSKSKVSLYSRPLQRQPPSSVQLTPREALQGTYPPIAGLVAAKESVRERYGYSSVEIHQKARRESEGRLDAGGSGRGAGRLQSPARASPNKQHALDGHSTRTPSRGQRQSHRDHRAEQDAMQGTLGAASGPIPSPMLLPSPSGAILDAAIGPQSSFIAPNLSSLGSIGNLPSPVASVERL